MCIQSARHTAQCASLIGALQSALRLTRCFGGDAQTWLNLQTSYDLQTVEIASAKAIKAGVEPIRIADFVQA